MKVRIEIDTHTFVRFWLVLAGLVLAAFAIFSARTALVIIGAALFLAVALHNPVTKLVKYLPGKSRIVSTAVSFTAIVVFLAGFIGLVVPPVIEQTAKVADSVPYLVDTAKGQWGLADDFIDRYNLQPQVDRAVESINKNASSWATNAGKTLISSVSSLFSFFAALLLTLVLAFLMLVEGPNWLRRLWGVYHDEERMKYHQKLLHRMHLVVAGYVTGQLAVSGIGALTAGLVVFALHFIFPSIPMNLALPTLAIAFVFSLIPMFGATIAGILITILLAFNDVTAAIVFAAFFIIYQQIENNFISPTIQSKTVELSALAVLVAVTIGLYVFGLAGGIISIPIAGFVKVFVEDHFERAKASRKKSQKPLHKFVKKIQEEA